MPYPDRTTHHPAPLRLGLADRKQKKPAGLMKPSNQPAHLKRTFASSADSACAARRANRLTLGVRFLAKRFEKNRPALLKLLDGRLDGGQLLKRVVAAARTSPPRRHSDRGACSGGGRNVGRQSPRIRLNAACGHRHRTRWLTRLLAVLLDVVDALLAEDLLHTLDGVTLGVKQMPNTAQKLHIFRAIVTAPTAPLHGTDLREACFPESQNMLLDIELISNLADGSKSLCCLAHRYPSMPWLNRAQNQLSPISFTDTPKLPLAHHSRFESSLLHASFYRISIEVKKTCSYSTRLLTNNDIANGALRLDQSDRMVTGFF
jgi:hypothetical protein